MKTVLARSVFRTIRRSIGRYLAIFAIIALGVGFFSGLRVTEEAMLRTADGYISDLNLHDFRLISTLGFTEEDEAAFSALEGITAYGSVSADLIYRREDGSDAVLHAHSLQNGIDGVHLLEGRMPTAANECVVDAKVARFSPVGTRIVLSESNPQQTQDTFSYEEYEVVGVVNAVRYMNYERGTTALAGGSVSGYIYIPRDGFAVEYFTEMLLDLQTPARIYSAAYENAMDAARPAVEAMLADRAEKRYSDIFSEAVSKHSEQIHEIVDRLGLDFDAAIAQYGEQIAARFGLVRATVYTLDRTANVGYASLENDTAIVSGVAKVFPLFFFLVAALVCITTMTRMVSELRVENGTLKALGYSNAAIAGQFLFYAGSASVLGAVAGFFLGSWLMPLALWQVYGILYSIARPVVFVLDVPLFLICTVAYLLCALGTTLYVCHRDLRESAAQLIRPKAPAPGKRVLLERVGWLWHRIPFLHKVTVRNISLSKRRMLMMVVSIAGCVALLLTGFGIRDSIRPILEYQYDEISLYDASVLFLEDKGEQGQADFSETAAPFAEKIAYLHTGTADVVTERGEGSVNLTVYRDSLTDFIHLHRGEKDISWPGVGEAVLNYRFAEEYGISVGDTVQVRDGEYRSMTVTVSGIFDNYIYDYIYIGADTCESGWGYIPPENTAYLRFLPGQDEHGASAAFLNAPNVASVSLVSDMKNNVRNMLKSLDYIVLIVLVCAGALAFIALYNLTNIAINERTREIATLRVLGFYPPEENAYVFRENIVLTAFGSLCGVPLGLLLLRYVMSQIKVGTMYFGCRAAPLSYLWAILLTFFFTLVVDFFLTFKMRRIDMTQALKAIE